MPEQKISLELDEAGLDPVHGPRPLKRVIQLELQNTLAERILAVDIPDGSTVPLGSQASVAVH